MNGDPLRVCIVTFGCQMNKLDSEILGGELTRAGFVLTGHPDDADAVLYNTCSVRQHAEDRVLSHLGSFRRRSQRDRRFILGVIGCMAQRLGGQIVRQFDFVDLIAGTRALTRVPGHLRRIAAGEGPIVDVAEDERLEFERAAGMRVSPHQAYVSIMRGCDNFCSYCIVPYVRGRETSRAPEDIAREVEALAADGVREVTLLGQNVNSYRFGDGGRITRLPGLLRSLNDVDGLLRIRFVTSHPKDMTDDVLDAVAGCDKVCEYLHVPAQSGSDAVLRAMHRRYTGAEYREMARRARATIPGVGICSDFMVGFPGETDADFEDTLRLVTDVGFHQSYVFKYSPRPGTAAARMRDDVPDAVKRERNQRLLAAQEATDTARRAAMVGSAVEVLVEGLSKQDESNLSGRTRQNDIVCFPGDPATAGELRAVRVTDSTPLTLLGRASA
jgi:tRNA-2-methylthio-N6-dimethylallyladenosine synthase